MKKMPFTVQDSILIVKKVRQLQRLTVQDLATHTGLALADAENAIETLSEKIPPLPDYRKTKKFVKTGN